MTEMRVQNFRIRWKYGSRRRAEAEAGKTNRREGKQKNVAAVALLNQNRICFVLTTAFFLFFFSRSFELENSIWSPNRVNCIDNVVQTLISGGNFAEPNRRREAKFRLNYVRGCLFLLLSRHAREFRLTLIKDVCLGPRIVFGRDGRTPSLARLAVICVWAKSMPHKHDSTCAPLRSALVPDTCRSR